MKPIELIIKIILSTILIFSSIFVGFSRFESDQSSTVSKLQIYSLKQNLNFSDLKKDDLVIYHRKEIYSFKTGDIVLYRFGSNDIVESEILIGVVNKLIKTKDDLIFNITSEKNFNIQQNEIKSNDIMGQYKFHVKKGGKAFVFLNTFPGRFIFIFLPFALLILFDVYTIKKQIYRDRIFEIHSKSINF